MWICAEANGHLQATGRDARGRKQYRYHPRWRAARDENKYARMADFGAALPTIRRRVADDLALRGLPREKVLAAVVRLLATTLIRVGNEEYARENHSFGLTTMRSRHVEVEGSAIEFRFRAKAGKWRTVRLRDRRLANMVKRCHDLPGKRLFQYEGDDGEPHPIGSSDVNDYLKAITGEDFTAKDFRTWAGTVAAAVALKGCEPADSTAQRRSNVVRAIEDVARQLGNTPAVCRKCYVHPAVIHAYLTGERPVTRRRRSVGCHHDDAALTDDEKEVLRILRREG